MDINIKIHKGKESLLQKIPLFLLGIFLCSSIFAISIDLLEKVGIWLGLIINIGLIFCGFYYIEKNTRTRVAIWGMITTLIFSIIAFIAIYLTITSSLEGL